MGDERSTCDGGTVKGWKPTSRSLILPQPNRWPRRKPSRVYSSRGPSRATDDMIARDRYFASRTAARKAFIIDSCRRGQRERMGMPRVVEPDVPEESTKSIHALALSRSTCPRSSSGQQRPIQIPARSIRVGAVMAEPRMHFRRIRSMRTLGSEEQHTP